ncbi:MAG: glycosyltransferase family 4 protein [Flavobacteriales bacterium]|nr:glycosyltransferase family 4 protein [Flavobacteriales bacterium]
MKILIICPYPKGKAPSQRFRFEQYLDLLDLEFDEVSFWKEDEWPKIYERGSVVFKVYRTIGGFLRRFYLLFRLVKYKKIFIHREATPIGPPWFEWLAVRFLKKEVIYDFDDSIWLPNSSDANRKIAGKFKNHTKAGKICSWASICVVGNEFLAEYARQYCADVRIIPTTIDTDTYHNRKLYKRSLGKWRKQADYPSINIKKVVNKPAEKGANEIDIAKKRKLTIGWTGTHSTLKQLIPLFTVLNELHDHEPFRFLLIADKAPPKLPKFVEFRKWKKESEIEDLLEIDIGVMPLFDTEWEKGKCGFKALQYMALEIPTVLSEVGVNIEISESGKAAYLGESLPLKSVSDWKESLLELIKEKPLRKKLGALGREVVDKKYSVKSQIESYRSVFKD